MTASGGNYAILYLLFMIPTYLLPWAGSNSSFVFIATLGMNPYFWIHLLSLGVLCALAWARGARTDRPWLVALPLLALVFDMVPGLNLIPFAPTALHLMALVLGYPEVPRSA